MRAAVLYGPRDIRLEVRETPKILDPTDAVIRMTVTCVCGSDLWPYRRPFATDLDHRRARGLRVLPGLSLLLGLLVPGGCEAAQQSTPGSPAAVAADAAPASVTSEESRMWMAVGERRFAITLTDNAAARAFAAQLPLTLDMKELNGNEKHAHLPKALPTNASRPGTIRDGDLMLYGTDTLVVFYLTFDSSYSYTRLGRVDDPSGLARALGRRGVQVAFSKD